MTDGLEDAMIAQVPTRMVEYGVDVLVKAIRDETVPSLIDSGAAQVTKDNMAEFQ
jgi:simple sugar transport system substrate-binding protein